MSSIYLLPHIYKILRFYFLLTALMTIQRKTKEKNNE